MELQIKNDNDVWTGIISGRIDAVEAEQFDIYMQPLMEHADKNLVIDCTELEYISSPGLRTFLTLRKKVANNGGSLIVTNINDDIRSIFTLTGFFNLFDIR